MSKFIGEISGSLVFRKDNVMQTELRPGMNALNLTGSLNITGSSLTFNGSDVINRIASLEAGSATGSSLLPLNLHSSSINTYTGSVDKRLAAIEIVSGTLETKVEALEQLTSSYFSRVDASNIVSSSIQVEGLGFIKNALSGSQQLLNLGFKRDVISGSQQIASLGFVTSSGIASFNQLSNIPSSIISSSAQIESLLYITGSTYQEITSKPPGIVSSSAQITALGFGTVNSGTVSSSLQIESLGFVTSSATTDVEGLNTFTGSIEIKVDNLTSASGSYLTGINAGILSSSAQITALGYITASVSSDVAGLNTFTSSIQTEVNSIKAVTGSFLSSLPNSIISSSAQISSLGFLSSAHTEIPEGTISSSLQIETLGYITSSVQSDVTGLNTFTSSIEATVQGLLSATSSYAVGSHSDITSINLFTGSIQSKVDNLTLSTGSLQNEVNALKASTGSYLNSLNAGILSSSLQVEALGYITASVKADVTGLNTFTGSIEASVLGLLQATSSYAVGSHSDITGLNNKTGSFASTGSNTFIGNQIVTGSIIPGSTTNDLGTSVKPWQHLYISSGSIKFMNKDGTQQSAFNNQFDGNRVVSNTEHPLFNSYNPGTANTIEDFLEAVFYPNTAPTISTGNQVVAEYEPIGTNLVTLAGADAESQAITFTIDSSYTDGYVNITSGVLKLAALPTVAAFNTTDRGDSVFAHPVIVRATDTIGAFTLKTIYVTVTANAAPQFRETSVGGNVISSFTTSRNENAAAGEITKIYFTDTETDTITITSGSDSGDLFSIVKSPTYVTINQVTGSLDYETKTTHTLSITASDQHFSDGDDSNSFVQIPITINVTDNTQPTVNDQTVTGLNENSADNAAAGTITATDPEGDTIVFKNAQPTSMDFEGTNIAIGTYTGTSVSDPSEDPFNISSTGVVTRKPSVFLNSDIINNYKYLVQVTDAYNNGTDDGVITIPISDDQAPVISGETSLYVIESAINGSSVYDNTNGYSGTTSQFTANQSVTWAVTPSSKLAINSSGYITVNYDVSGSSDVGGTQISGVATATNAFNTNSTRNFTINVTDNTAPTITFTNTNANLNTNKAIAGNNLVALAFNDSEGNTIDYTSYSASFNGDSLESVVSGTSRLIRATSPLTAGVYSVTASIADEHGFETRTSSHAFTIAQAHTGTLTNNGTYYIIESAGTGDIIRTNTNGRTGTQGDVGVNYSPNYGSQVVQAFTSSNAAIAVNSSGNLSLNLNISGSTTGSGDTITSTIQYQDQYNNHGSSNITINVATNNNPSVTISEQGSLETDSITSGVLTATVSISDTEADYPITLALSGTHASSFTAVSNNSNGTSFNINANSALAAGTYSFTATATDAFGKTGTDTGNVVIAQSADYGKVYVYTSTYGSDAGFGGNYNAVMGASTLNGDTPPQVTAYTGNTASPYYKFKAGAIGDSSISLAGSQSATLQATLSGSNLDTVLASAGLISAATTGQIIVLFPSGSDMSNLPTSIQETFNSVAGGAVPCLNVDGGGFLIETGELHSIVLDTAHLGYNEWFVFGRKSQNAIATAFKIRLVAANGSLPT